MGWLMVGEWNDMVGEFTPSSRVDFSPTNLKNMRNRQIGEDIFPKVRGENKQDLGCHHRLDTPVNCKLTVR